MWKVLGIWQEILETIPNKFFSNANDLSNTFDKFGRLSKSIKGEIYNYYKQQKWDKLEKIFREHNLYWPPADGGYNTIYNIALKKGMSFDRYGNAIEFIDETPILGGEFTSPIINRKYTFAERALNKLEKEYDFYYEIEVIKDLPFTGDISDVIPWFGQKGKQVKWNIPINEESGYKKTWNELVKEGYIKVIIKDSPSGKFKNLINKEIK